MCPADQTQGENFSEQDRDAVIKSVSQSLLCYQISHISQDSLHLRSYQFF